MTARLKSAQRIVQVQRDLQRVAEWRHAEIERRVHTLEETRRDLVRFLSDEHAFAGLLASNLARRLRSLASEIGEARAALAAQAETVLNEARRAKRAERVAESLQRDARRLAERQELMAAIEGAVARPPASPP
jgi:hypothetical protein